jgi:hypothetical protein
VPTLAGEPFIEDPPLFVLTAALLSNITSPILAAHDGARLAAGFFVALAFAFTAAAGREQHGRGRGWVATLILLGSLGLLVPALALDSWLRGYSPQECLDSPVSLC